MLHFDHILTLAVWLALIEVELDAPASILELLPSNHSLAFYGVDVQKSLKDDIEFEYEPKSEGDKEIVDLDDAHQFHSRENDRILELAALGLDVYGDECSQVHSEIGNCQF